MFYEVTKEELEKIYEKHTLAVYQKFRRKPLPLSVA